MQQNEAGAVRETTEGFRPAEATVSQLLKGAKMAKKAVKPAPKRARFKVEQAGLVGVNWDTRKVSKSIYIQSLDLCKDLSYWLNRRVATVVGPAKPNGVGWNQLVCWPGRGMFVVVLKAEEA